MKPSPRARGSFPLPGRGGFSLVELLVTIGIVAVLAALILPVMDNARGRARSVGCLSSLRQLYVGATLFANENNGSLPYNTTSDGDPNNLQSFWYYQASDYALDNAKASNGSQLICPDGPWFPGKQVAPFWVGQATYGMNFNLLSTLDLTTGKVTGQLTAGKLMRLDRIANASSTVLYFDAGSFATQQTTAKNPVPAWGYIPGYSANAGKTFYAGNARVTTDARKGRHGKTICFVHADGSLGSQPVEQFVNDNSNWTATLRP